MATPEIAARWAADDLYSGPDDPALWADLAVARQAAEAAVSLAALDGEGLTARRLREALDALNTALLHHGQLSAYATMLTLTNSGNSSAQAFLETCQALQSRNELTTATLGQVLSRSDTALLDDPELATYRPILLRQRAEAARIGSPEALTAAMEKSETHALAQLRGQMEAAMTATVTLDGRTQTLPITEVRGLLQSADGEARRQGHLAEAAACSQHAGSFAAILNAIKGEGLTLARLRGHDSVLDWMLSLSRMERATLDAMEAAVIKALPHFRRFIAAKGRLLGHCGPMPYYDLNAPLGRTVRRFSLPEAGDFLTEALASVDGQLEDFVRRAFQSRWLDTEPRAGKQGGAMCIPLPLRRESRVFANFDGSLPGVILLGHELGHGWHHRCTFHLPMVLQDAPTPVCETASTFHETVTYERALAAAQPEEQLFLLDSLLSNAVRNIADMHARYIFEDRLLARLVAGPLDDAALCSLMAQCQREVYQDSLNDTLNPWQWMSKVHYYIPHFHYYSFPYTFGLLFSQGLYGQFAAGEKDFFPRYCAMLGKTGTASVEETGTVMGLDLRAPAFWQVAMAGFAEKIDAFVELAKGT